MKPTYGIRKFSEYTTDPTSAFIINDTDKDKYYWADIPDGSLLVNTKTGTLSIKLEGEIDWVPCGVKRDGTEKLLKSAVIEVEFFTIIDIQDDKVLYHDIHEISRVAYIKNNKASFKIGRGLYLPGTNQLEVFVNDVIRRTAATKDLVEENMKYFSIDLDDLIIGSTLTVRYIDYERLSEVYPYIYLQKSHPWFFEDKDIWIDKRKTYHEDTPLSWYIEKLDADHAHVVVYADKESRLILTKKQNELYNIISTRYITKFSVPLEDENYFLNVFASALNKKTSFQKILIQGKNKRNKEILDINKIGESPTKQFYRINSTVGYVVAFYTDDSSNSLIYRKQSLTGTIDFTVTENHPRRIRVVLINPKTNQSVLTKFIENSLYDLFENKRNEDIERRKSLILNAERLKREKEEERKRKEREEQERREAERRRLEEETHRLEEEKRKLAEEADRLRREKEEQDRLHKLEEERHKLEEAERKLAEERRRQEEEAAAQRVREEAEARRRREEEEANRRAEKERRRKEEERRRKEQEEAQNQKDRELRELKESLINRTEAIKAGLKSRINSIQDLPQALKDKFNKSVDDHYNSIINAINSKTLKEELSQIGPLLDDIHTNTDTPKELKNKTNAILAALGPPETFKFPTKDSFGSYYREGDPEYLQDVKRILKEKSNKIFDEAIAALKQNPNISVQDKETYERYFNDFKNKMSQRIDNANDKSELIAINNYLDALKNSLPNIKEFVHKLIGAIDFFGLGDRIPEISYTEDSSLNFPPNEFHEDAPAMTFEEAKQYLTDGINKLEIAYRSSLKDHSNIYTKISIDNTNNKILEAIADIKNYITRARIKEELLKFKSVIKMSPGDKLPQEYVDKLNEILAAIGLKYKIPNLILKEKHDIESFKVKIKEKIKKIQNKYLEKISSAQDVPTESKNPYIKNVINQYGRIIATVHIERNIDNLKKLNLAINLLNLENSSIDDFRNKTKEIINLLLQNDFLVRKSNITQSKDFRIQTMARAFISNLGPYREENGYGIEENNGYLEILKVAYKQLTNRFNFTEEQINRFLTLFNSNADHIFRNIYLISNLIIQGDNSLSRDELDYRNNLIEIGGKNILENASLFSPSGLSIELLDLEKRSRNVKDSNYNDIIDYLSKMKLDVY